MFISNPSDGIWKVLVETKLLSESKSQDFALVITSEIGSIIREPINETSLPENILEQCYPGSPLNPETDHSSLKSLVDVSIFNFWSSLSSVVASGVSISPMNDDDVLDTIYTLPEHHQVYEAGRLVIYSLILSCL